VRLITTISPGELEQDADMRLRSFMQDLLPNLSGYLPTADTVPQVTAVQK
jgi:hypothetical protein